uniref:Asparaginyl-tRNA synthetase 1 n=1 Tax=Cyclopterus lumpus TaxID=8103 RepID=A0A8C3AEP0_CYCLU
MATELTKGELYVSDKCGSDQDGDGTDQKPFKTPLQALMFAGKEPFPSIYVESQKEGERWAVISKTQMKNAKKAFNREQTKCDSKEKKEAEDTERREKNLEEAKKINIENDPSLPEPDTVKIRLLETKRGQRVKVFGWVHRLRRQGKNLMFIVLRDGTGFLQCVLSDKLVRRLEDLVCDVVDRVLKSPAAQLLYDINPNFKPPKRPFKRMNYTDAIEWLREHDIKKDDGSYYEFGEVTTEHVRISNAHITLRMRLSL